MTRRYFIYLSLSCCIWLADCNEPVAVTLHVPVIHSLSVDRSQIYVQEFVTLQAEVTDQDKGDQLTFQWSATGGTFTNPANNPTQWHAPTIPDSYTLILIVSDGTFEVADSTTVKVLPRP
jgi:hypothetical protein